METSATVQLIRNASLILNYAGHKILVDPMFSPKGALDSFAGIERNPTVELPISVEEIIQSLDLVLVTHTHADHFDLVAGEKLNKSIKLFHQPADKEFFSKENYTNAVTIEDQIIWNNIHIYRTGGQHGSGEILKRMGIVSGFVLIAKDQPTIYIVGDSIWTEEVEQAIQKFKPDYIIANTGGAVIPGFETTPILMDENHTISVIQESGSAKIIAVHMEALDHCRTSRTSLRHKAIESQIGADKLMIPEDGETIFLS